MVFGLGKANPPPPPPPLLEQSVVDAFGLPSWAAEISVLEGALLIVFVAFLTLVHVYGRVTPMKTHATLNMASLNKVNIFKEVFLGYVNAGMLEPILAIASSDDPSTKALVINLAQLCGLFSWLYLLTDAFDNSDTQQAYVYWTRLTKCGKVTDLPRWLKHSAAAHVEGRELRGSLLRDLALWSMLGCSFFAFFGVVSHRDVIHSHAILLMWGVLHHQSRKATAWRGTGYWHTLFAPSTALLPLEYCLNLIDQDMISDEDGVGDLGNMREFIKAESGVELTIEA